MGSVGYQRHALLVGLLAVVLAFSAPTQAHDPHGEQWPGHPHHETIRFDGVIGCTAAYALFGPQDLCKLIRERIGLEHAQYENGFEFPMAAGLSTLIVSMDANENLLTPPWLHLTWMVPVDSIPELRGETPVAAEYAFTPDMRFTQHADDALLMVRSDSEADVPQVYVETSFHVCLGLFYNGAVVPADFDPCA